MPKIKVLHPIVEMDGDEMTRVMWQWIRQQLILPYLDVDLDYHDLSVEERDRSADEATVKAAHATLKHGVAVKCATVTHDRERMLEYGSPKMLKSPNGTIRQILNGTLFREPILFRNVPRLVPHWDKPVVIGRHAFGDQHGAADFTFKGKGRLTFTFVPDDGGEAIEREIYAGGEDGIGLAMYNTDSSIIGFARACFNYGLLRRYPVYLSTKNTILKVYDGRFKDLFQQVFETEFAGAYSAAGLTYEHRLIDDMVASNLKWSGGYLWACKNYDGDVQSDTVAQGYGSLGAMTSALMSPQGVPFEAEAAHGTVTRHYRAHQAGRDTSTNPIASIFAWTRGLIRRGEIDRTADVVAFAKHLEAACIATVESGVMTRDLAGLVGASQPAASTRHFLDAVDKALRSALG
jgi:isocitrate dehydrogenase